MKHEEFAKLVADFRKTGKNTPCADSPDWTSEDPTERLRAVELCAGCPLRQACREYGNSSKQAWGVYGGRDFASSGRPRAEDPVELIAQIRHLRANEWSRKQIAEHLNMTVTSLDHLIRRHGLTIHKPTTDEVLIARTEKIVELRENHQLSFSAIAERLGITTRQAHYSYQQAKRGVAA